ncbi:E3 ubiquitin-protein ligase FANCL-like [Amphiura filiformis]|uniref:E3 ubiquitin-protein ligase FANCL-like n=1 Tax=Amphiura filiformis TaxID=82378 RepID=UPI003B21F097
MMVMMCAAKELSLGDVFSVCPLVPLDLHQTIWQGFITVHGEDYQLRLELPSTRKLQNARLFGEWKLNHHLERYKHVIMQRLQSAKDLATFLLELQTLLERTMSKSDVTSTSAQTVSPALYTKLISEIEDIGWDRLSSIDASFESLQFSAVDGLGKIHYITINLNSQYPDAVPACSVSLPTPFELQWSSKGKLKDILQQFQVTLEKHKVFWQSMSEIDNQTWVLEPDKPMPSDSIRRIALGNNSSLQVTVDPLHPGMLPECRFLGADHVVKPLKEKLHSNLHLWDTDCSILTNLQKVLQVEFPSPSSTQKQELSEECGICYTYRLESAIPDQACDNPQCNKPFHQACLYEFTSTLPSSHQTMSKYGFNTTYGECPYCNQPITVKKMDT